MYCEHCGERIEEGAVFCDQCGHRIENEPEDINEAYGETTEKHTRNKLFDTEAPGEKFAVAGSRLLAAVPGKLKSISRKRLLVIAAAVVAAAVACIIIFGDGNAAVRVSDNYWRDLTQCSTTSDMSRVTLDYYNYPEKIMQKIYEKEGVSSRAELIEKINKNRDGIWDKNITSMDIERISIEPLETYEWKRLKEVFSPYGTLQKAYKVYWHLDCTTKDHYYQKEHVNDETWTYLEKINGKWSVDSEGSIVELLDWT